MERWAGILTGNARTRFLKVRMAWRFFNHLLDLKVVSSNPTSSTLLGLGRRPSSSFQPFIFTQEQVAAILDAARQLPSNPQFPIAITSGEPADATRPRPVWWFRARCGWWRAWQRDCVRRKDCNCRRGMSMIGEGCEPTWTSATNVAASNCAFAAIRRTTSASLKNAYFRQVCRRRKNNDQRAETSGHPA